MRQNVGLKYSNHKNKIYIYSHWDGDKGMSPLKKMVQRAIARKQRWYDESYLARIITSEILSKDIDGETGYGIAPYPSDEEYPTIKVDLEKQTVDGVSFDKFINEI